MSGTGFVRSESAVSSVVAAVLVLGILVSVITVINVSYIPEWKTGAEQSHMDEVFYDMSNLKSDIDILCAVAGEQTTDPISLSIPLRMGGGSIPVISPGRSSGMLSINMNELSMRTTASDTLLSYSSGTFLEDLGSVSYHSGNSYFVNQVYEYESGALILAQNELSLMRRSPSLELRRTDNNTNVTIGISAVQLMGPVKSISSNSIEEVYLRYNYSDTLYAGEELFTELTLIIETGYPSAWEGFLEGTVADAGLDTSEYSLSSNSTAVTFKLEGAPGEDVKANIRKNVFDVRLNVFEN